jgi:hypothetical protein
MKMMDKMNDALECHAIVLFDFRFIPYS